MHEEFPDLDVIVISEARELSLKKSLYSLHLAARNYPVKLMLGLNGSTELYRQNIESLTQNLNFLRGVEIFKFQRMLPGKARNQLLTQSTAQWIFFCDDDVSVPEEIFKNFYKLRTQFLDVSAFGGPNISPAESGEVERVQGYALQSFLVSGPMSNRYKKSDDKKVKNSLSLTLCNLFWKRQPDVLFPPHFICGEELDLIKKTHQPFFSTNQLFVYHQRRSNWLHFLRQTFKYGIGRAQASPLIVLSAWVLFSAFVIAICKYAVESITVVLFYLVILGFSFLQTIRLQKEKLSSLPNFYLATFIIHVGYFFGLLIGSLKNLTVLSKVLDE